VLLVVASMSFLKRSNFSVTKVIACRQKSKICKCVWLTPLLTESQLCMSFNCLWLLQDARISPVPEQHKVQYTLIYVIWLVCTQYAILLYREWLSFNAKWAICHFRQTDNYSKRKFNIFWYFFKHKIGVPQRRISSDTVYSITKKVGPSFHFTAC